MSRYATLEMLKAHVSVVDALDDVELETSLNAAEGLIDEFARRRFDAVDPDDPEAVSTRVYDDSGWVDDVVAVDEVEVRRGGTWQTFDGWELWPFNAAADGRPHTRLLLDGPAGDRIRVTGWFGWPDVPDAVVQAALLQGARLAQRRSAPFGIQTVPNLDGSSPMRLLARLDADVELLVAPLRRRPVLV